MSEGINFSDGYARCVVVVGLPYPNANDIELKEKMQHATKNTSNGSEYYENLCMKAVNQSIGRSIRHAKDYASIILLDKRYVNSTQIRNKLPKWIRSRLQCCTQFGEGFPKIGQFFKAKVAQQKEFEEARKIKMSKIV
jgi:chromosome transmission fidelity protein 1